MSITVYFDFETGGVNNEPSIQLAAIAVDAELNEVGTFEQKIKFDPAECIPQALEINGYTEESWKDAIAPPLVASRFSAWLKPFSTVEIISKRTGNPYRVAQLAGYNAQTFDLPRLKLLYGDSFFPCSYQVRDILQRTIFFFDENPGIEKPKSMKLAHVAEYFGIDSTGAHDALTDVRLTVAVYRAILRQAQ